MHRARKMGRAHSWYLTTQSHLLADFDRQEIRIGSGNMATASSERKLPSGVFQPRSQGSSLPHDLVKTISDDTWRSPSPVAFATGSYATAAMLACGRNLSSFKSAFLSMLFEPGSLVYNTATKQGFWVVGSSQCGVHMWHASLKRAPNSQ